MEAYCSRQGKSMQSIRFLFDGERINADQTPNDLGMDDEDTIEVALEQLGGTVV